MSLPVTSGISEIGITENLANYFREEEELRCSACQAASQLCSGHERMEEQDILTARQKHRNDDYQLQETPGRKGGGLPTTRKCIKVQSSQELPKESCSSAQQTCWASASRCH